MTTNPLKWGFVELMGCPLDTITNTPQTPQQSTFEPLCKTYDKLKRIDKLLGRHNLVNTKYLHKRKNIYYF